MITRDTKTLYPLELHAVKIDDDHQNTRSYEASEHSKAQLDLGLAGGVSEIPTDEAHNPRPRRSTAPPTIEKSKDKEKRFKTACGTQRAVVEKPEHERLISLSWYNSLECFVLSLKFLVCKRFLILKCSSIRSGRISRRSRLQQGGTERHHQLVTEIPKGRRSQPSSGREPFNRSNQESAESSSVDSRTTEDWEGEEQDGLRLARAVAKKLERDSLISERQKCFSMYMETPVEDQNVVGRIELVQAEPESLKSGFLPPSLLLSLPAVSLSLRHPVEETPAEPACDRDDPASVLRELLLGLSAIDKDSLAGPVRLENCSLSEDAVYRSFERALEKNNLHSLWVGFDCVVLREVFRRLGLRELFLRGAVAPRKEEGAVETALYLQQTCLLRREKEALVRREEELAKSAAARRLASKGTEPYFLSLIVQPATLNIEPLPAIQPQPGSSAPTPETVPVTPRHSTNRSLSSQAKKGVSDELAKQFKKHGITTLDDEEEAALKSPESPCSA
ncbi:hypothetical protein OUZ56_029535 [Daphnia magna]|uniref:Uncharacterized protein n=1 Tax=Daphnia magna TaxID=35525 RepID=A0ABR0B7I9_9CRUS|nr:hypothetical protein OUZ56_029535 [Daphnia magna]